MVVFYIVISKFLASRQESITKENFVARVVLAHRGLLVVHQTRWETELEFHH